VKLIDRHDIEGYAKRYDAKGYLPYLISRLVRATTPQSTFVEFPDGSSTFVGGWDGVVECEKKTSYVPEGKSLWEFGTEASQSSKAESDYQKRTDDPLEYDPSECTLVVVTPRFWKNKASWKKKKIKEGIWNNVLVYDSRNLEEWLDISPTTSRWFSTHVQKYPADGIITVEEFWKEWSIGPSGQLPPKVVTAGREREADELLNFLKGNPGIKTVKASSKDEAVAFIIASAMQFEDNDAQLFNSKSLVIETIANFRSIRINTHSLNLIAKFEETQPLYAAAADGHHVIVPVGPDDTFDQNTLTLPLIEREGQIEALVSMGLSKEDANKYSKESARNITVLKSLLKFPKGHLKWAEKDNAKDLIPAMLIGRWDENKIGDIELIEKLSGEKYEEYTLIISKWRDTEAAPLIQIGSTWRLTSPLDAWANLSSSLTVKNLNVLKECFFDAFKFGNPFVEPEEDKAFSQFFSKETKFSSWAREGLIQSLILIGLYGEGLKINEMISPQSWVDDIIQQLFNEADGTLWVSLNHEMPLIAEASPSSFLESINESLKKDNKPIMAMFEEKEGLITPTSNHTGLLWALEGLAWDSDYLFGSALALSKLSALDPGGNLSNRPINSLTEIFKPWHYQTLATLEERLEVIGEITHVEKEIGWTLLLRMLPEHHGVGHPTHKMRWRMFDKSFDQIYTYQEIWDTHSSVVDMLISVFDHTEPKLSDLFDKIDNLSEIDRDKILEFLDSEIDKINQIEFTAWHTLRNTLSHHRSHPDADWALPEPELQKLEELYNKLQPTDVISRYKWLFDDHWPSFPEGTIYDESISEGRHDFHQKKIDENRMIGLNAIISMYGIDGVIELSQEVKESWSLGDTLAKIINKGQDVISITKLLERDDRNETNFVQAFIYRKAVIEGNVWVFNLYDKLSEIGMNNSSLAKLFVPINQSQELWSFLGSLDTEINKQYWLLMRPHFYHITQEEKIFGVEQLIRFKRFFSAIDICSHFSDEIPTKIIAELLEKAATEKAEEDVRLRGYEISQLFESIDKRDDIEHQQLIKLEWLYIPVLSSYGNRRNPKNLHEELATNPEFFLDILKWVFMPKDKELIEKEREGLDDELIRNRAEQGYKLLSDWKKIPGVSDDGTIDSEYLNNWITKVRVLAKDADRLDVADMQIGKILAQYPENNLNWPPDEICAIIQEINTDSIKRNFSSAVFNKRSFSSRGPFEGGNIERGHAEYFKILASNKKKKFPVVAKIFDQLALGYLADAKRMDESAERDKLDY